MFTYVKICCNGVYFIHIYIYIHTNVVSLMEFACSMCTADDVNISNIVVII